MTATHGKDLRTGRSPWMSRPLRALPQSVPKRDLKADVIVVGAGISGALVADLLTDAGLTVILFDRRGPLLGSTPASTALLQYEIDTPLTLLTEAIGRERAERVWRRSKLALEALHERARHLAISADISTRDTLYLAGDLLGPEALALEAEARRRAGFEVSLVKPSVVAGQYGLEARAAILGHGNVAADPRRLAAGFLRNALTNGARLYAPVEVVGVESHSRGVTVTTDVGPVARADHLVFATGYELPVGVPRKGHRIVSTFCLATKPQPRTVPKAMPFVWEASEPYLYLRRDQDGRIICGGEDEEFADEERRDAMLHDKVGIIRDKLGRLMPGIDTAPEYAWCGSFGASPTGTPSIGAVPGMANCSCVLGYGGNGITFSMMAAQIIRGLVTGTGDPDADLFSFRRRF